MSNMVRSAILAQCVLSASAAYLWHTDTPTVKTYVRVTEALGMGRFVDKNRKDVKPYNPGSWELVDIGVMRDGSIMNNFPTWESKNILPPPSFCQPTHADYWDLAAVANNKGKVIVTDFLYQYGCCMGDPIRTMEYGYGSLRDAEFAGIIMFSGLAADVAANLVCQPWETNTLGDFLVVYIDGGGYDPQAGIFMGVFGTPNTTTWFEVTGKDEGGYIISDALNGVASLVFFRFYAIGNGLIWFFSVYCLVKYAKLCGKCYLALSAIFFEGIYACAFKVVQYVWEPIFINRYGSQVDRKSVV